MIEFLALLIIASVSCGRSIVGLLRQRFLHPTDFAIVSTYYYAVPLAMCGYFSYNYHGLIFLHPQAADPALALQSMRYVVLAILSLEAARIAGLLMGPPNFHLSFRLDHAKEIRTLIWFIALLGLMMFGIFLFGVKEFLSGYATESFKIRATLGNALVYASVELLGLTIMLALLLGQVHGRVPLKGWIAISIVAILFFLAVREKRLEAVSAFLPALVILLATVKWISNWKTRLIVAGTAIGILIIISIIRVSDTPSLAKFILYSGTEGLYAGHSLPGIEARLEVGTTNYEYGARFLNALLGFIPRFIWPGKDAMIYDGNIALEGVSPLGATTFLSEVVLQGGYIAVFITYSVMGFVFERLMKAQAVWDQGLAAEVLPLRFGAYLVALVIFVPHFRDGIIPAIKLSLQSFFFFVLLAGVQFHGTTRVTRRVPMAAS